MDPRYRQPPDLVQRATSSGHISTPPRVGVTFLALLEVEDGVENPLPALPEARAFYERLPEWYAEPPEVVPGTAVGSHHLFSEVGAAV